MKKDNLLHLLKELHMSREQGKKAVLTTFLSAALVAGTEWSVAQEKA